MKRKPELFEDKLSPGDWRVERLDPDGEGAVDVAIFSGTNAQRLAADYFDWQRRRDGVSSGKGKLQLVRREVVPRA